MFVPFAVPGDVVDIQVNKTRKSFWEGYVVRFHSYSKTRVEPFCSHFGTCGGCKWQSLPYSEQLKYKQQQVVDSLQRIAKVPLPEINKIIGSEDTMYYRNKLEYTFSNRRWMTNEEISNEEKITQPNGLGFHIPKLFDKVLDIEKCYLQDDLSNQIRNFIRRFTLANNYTYFDIRNHNGLMRNLIVRNTSIGQWMVIVVFYDDDIEKRNLLLDAVKNEFPQITSLNFIVNQKANDSIFDQEVVCYNGESYITEEMENLKFRIGPKSFYQTNSKQAYVLYKIAREFAEFTDSDVVYDLYTGTGTIANFISSRVKQVVGIEYIDAAVEDAKVNSEVNNISNTTFVAGDMKDILKKDFFEQHGYPNTIITDPPRAGMHNDVINVILESNAEKIVYISCNPATQARDIELLYAKYNVAKIQPVDMFPHTHHIENVILLVKKIDC